MLFSVDDFALVQYDDIIVVFGIKVVLFSVGTLDSWVIKFGVVFP